MSRRLPVLLIFSVLACLLMVSTADAQSSRSDKARSLRAEQTLYLKARVGLSTYGGDRDLDSPESFLSLKFGDKIKNASWSLGPEIGYAFSPYFSAGLSYQLANYSEINKDFPFESSVADGSAPDLDQDESSKLRHTLAVSLRWLPLAHWRVSPYLEGGVHYTLGSVELVGGGSESASGYGPLVGLGVDIATGSKLSFFLETRGYYAFPDDGVDLADPISDENDTSFDLLGFYGGGLTYTFKSPCSPVQVLTVEGPERAAIGEPVTFTATVNENASTQDLTYEWDLGDGTTASGLTVTHTYDTPATYYPTVTATNCGGPDVKGLGWGTENSLLGPEAEAAGFDPDTGGRGIEIYDPCPVPAEIVSMSSDPSDPIINEAIQFSANVNADPPVDSYQWDFGDGTTSSEVSPSHTYTDPGEYIVTLEVTNCGDQTDTETLNLVVREFRCSEITELNSVFFERNSTELDDEARALLDENIAILLECPEINVRLDGYADRGERNPQTLSEERAQAVEQYYIDNGISPNRLTARGLGVDPLAGKGKDGMDRRNRRVDSIIIR